MSATATYTETGEISVTDEGTYLHIGQFDADGGEWADAVDSQLAEAGFVRTGDWVDDRDGDTAPCQRA